ncbi:hypothetical protein SLE2022_241530 [Rubroshorea leprosula]
MDDSCAVCADSLEWVAYGACGHREVCSTCVARLRFICDDRRCCICKTECNVVFVTKALGDYTRMINDFSVLLAELREGKVGPYWYHEDTQAFFDDGDHYKMIKAMCKLSCSVCDKMDEQPNDGSKRRGKFRNIGQLKGHLFHCHKLLMCSLCLEGRKVFICEQKLYTRTQLNQHISTGDSKVDGSESERGGFNGHPRCEFCRTPFYGDNELYSHMSTEHYTCHLCQRQHPGQYEYYKNYDDLEIHFRRDHYLCEDEACLGKKFIVFQSEAELKRHNAIEHGGCMSRAKRNAALQIPTSFRFRRSNEENRRGRGQTFRPELSDYQLSMAIEASLVTTAGEPPPSSSGQVVSDNGDTNSGDPIIQPFESLSTTDSDPPSRYLQAVAQGSRGVPLEESSFPPLSTAPSTGQQSTKPNSDALPSNTMAAHLRRQRNVHVLNLAQAWPVASSRSVQPSSSPVQFRPTMPATSHDATASTGAAVLSYASSALGKAQSTTVNGLISLGSSSASSGYTGRISDSASTPSLADGQPSIPSASDFPPVSTMQMRKMPSNSQAPTNVENIHTANKSLVEKVRAALEYDEDKYTAFKDITGQYRQGLIDTGKYLNYVNQYELSHLLLELARLCPDAQKQRELIETYNASMRSNGLQEKVGGHGNLRLKDDNSSRKGKGKSLVAEDGHSKDALVDGIISTVRKLQSNDNPSEEEVEVLSKDGYRRIEGKSKVMASEQLVELSSQNHGSKNDSVSTGGGSAVGGGGSKQRKKTSKFQRLRLGDGSMEAILNPKNSEPEQLDHRLDGNQNPTGGLPVRGVWRTGGGQKLFP